MNGAENDPQTHICLTGGWFSSDNIGDQAILLGITDSFSAHFQPRYSVITAAPQKVRSQHGLPAFAPKKTPLRLVKNLLSADALVFTGGTPFYDAKPHMSYYAALAKIAHARGIPVIVFGISLRSIKSRYCRALMRRVACWADFLGAREDKTVRAFRALAGNSEKVQTVPDVAIQMKPSEPARAGRLLSGEGGDPSARNVSICLRDFRAGRRFQRHHYSRRYESATLEQYHDAIRSVAEHVVRKHDCNIVFCPMHTRGEDDDRRIADEIRDAVRDAGVRRRMTSIQRQHSPRDMKAILGSMHANIGVRFHSLVLATSMHVPSAAVAYAHKNLAIMDYVGQSAYAADLARTRADELCYRVDRLLENHSEIADGLRSRFEEIDASYRVQLARIGELIDGAKTGAAPTLSERASSLPKAPVSLRPRRAA